MATTPDSSFLSTKRYAVVTGANKGIGLEICRQLASKGVAVVLTSRDQNRGRETVEILKSIEDGISVEFHQLDVADPASVASLADFIKTQFGKLDILVNNAAVVGALVPDSDLLRSSFAKPYQEVAYKEVMTQTYELAEDCININYYGTKRTTEALPPLLYLSDSPRIVNVSSGIGKLRNIPNERVRTVLDNIEDLTEIDEVLGGEYLKDFKEGKWAEKGWPTFLSAYTVSKAAMNSYTRVMSKTCRHLAGGVDVNCVSPGYVKTDINVNSGHLTTEEGAQSLVRLALLPRGESSGLFYLQKEVAPYV